MENDTVDLKHICMYKGYNFCIPWGKSFENTDIYYYKEKGKKMITCEILEKIWERNNFSIWGYNMSVMTLFLRRASMHYGLPLTGCIETEQDRTWVGFV